MSSLNSKIEEFHGTVKALRDASEENAAQPDALLDAKIQRINNQIDAIESSVKNAQASQNAQAASAKIKISSNERLSQGASSFSPMEIKAFGDYLRKGAASDYRSRNQSAQSGASSFNSGSIGGNFANAGSGVNGMHGHGGLNGHSSKLHRGMERDSSIGGGLKVSSSRGYPSYNNTYTVADSIYDYLQDYSIIRNLCSTVMISGEYFDAPCVTGASGATWSDGTSAAAPTENIVTKVIDTFDLTAQPKVTQKMIDDVMINLESWITEQLAAVFMTQENDAFISGTGSNQPRGILTYPVKSDNSTASADSIFRVMTAENTGIDADSVMQLSYSLSDYYANNAAFVMNKSTVQAIRTLKDTSTGQYYWMPGLLSGTADTLLGSPLYTCEAVPSIGAGNDVIIYGNFKRGYQIVDRGDLSIQRDPYTSKPFVLFYATKRVGGDVIDANAFAILRVAS